MNQIEESCGRKNTLMNKLIYIVVGILLLAMAEMPYAYYKLLRIVVTFTAAFLAYKEYDAYKDLNGWLALLCLIAIVYNPIIPVHLTKAIWIGVNIITIILLLAYKMPEEIEEGKRR